MAVEGVNNSNNNKPLMYSAGAAATGAVGGTIAAYTTKPFFKDGLPTDSFIMRIAECDSSEAEDIKGVKDLLKNKSRLRKIENIEDVKSFFKEFPSVAYLFKKNENQSIDEFIKEIDNLDVAAQLDLKYDLAGYRQNFCDSVMSFYDEGLGKFVSNSADTDAAVNVLNKAAKKVQGRYALLYGSLAAALLGLGTYVGIKAHQNTPEKVDVKA